jgi:alanine-synthesizing transaminase
MQNKFFLVEKLPQYIFAKINELKIAAKNRGLEIIDFGMGNPDLAPPNHVVEKLSKLTLDGTLFGYSNSGGILELKQAFCAYYQRRFNVNLEATDESLVTIGAKEGIASLSSAIADSDNYICIATPAYPIHNFAYKIARSNVVEIAAICPYDYLKKFKDFVINAQKKPQAVIVSYPSNPTGEIVDLAFYQELVDFCKKQQIYIISDLAYCEIYFSEKDKPHSILEIQGAKDIAIEFSSLSKSFSMPGCRVGFAAGNKTLIAALAKIKSFLDYGSFTPIQISAIEALSEKSDEYLKNIRQIYKQRANFMADIFQKELGWNITKPKAGMFVWTKLPEKFSNLSSAEFCEKLINECGVAFTQGSAFGENGEGFVRISLIQNEEKVRKAVNKLKNIF